jgi:hypothetical protein
MCVLPKHCGVDVRRFGLVIGVLAVMAAAASQRAIALEEQRGQVPAGVATPDTAKAVEDQAAAKSDAGTEIRIPGLGKLGTLPKMDFGLELLYGAAEGKSPADSPEPQDDDSRDLMIHGTVKHRF